MRLSYYDLNLSDELFMRSVHGNISNIEVITTDGNTVVDADIYFTVDPLEPYPIRSFEDPYMKNMIVPAINDLMELAYCG